MAKPKNASDPNAVVISDPDNVKTVYINNMELQISGMEVRIQLNELIPDGRGSARGERRASVVMSITHFRAMVHVLQQNLQGAIEAAASIERALGAAKTQDERKA